MTAIQPYHSHDFRPSPADQRRTSRSLSRLAGQTGVELAVIEARATVEAARADALASVAQVALTNVALLTQTEQALAQTVPAASGRLNLIAEHAALGLAEIVVRTARKL